MFELAERIRSRSGAASPIELVPYEVAYDKGFEDMRRRVPHIGKIRAATGWAPTHTLDEILDEVIADARQELSLTR
jgi:UDP-glucose 4-epimerase